MTTKPGLCPHIPLVQSFLSWSLMCNESLRAQTSSCDDLPAGAPLFQVGLNFCSPAAAFEDGSFPRWSRWAVKRLQNPFAAPAEISL